jgi:hypothetical protein
MSVRLYGKVSITGKSNPMFGEGDTLIGIPIKFASHKWSNPDRRPYMQKLRQPTSWSLLVATVTSATFRGII